MMTQIIEDQQKRSHGKALSLKTQVEALSLYEQDILLWVEDTIAKLKSGDFVNLDLVNLIEEVESVGISQKRQLSSRLMVLLEHLLKRMYVNSTYDNNGWERTIRTQRNHLLLLLKQVPSLKTYWSQSFEDAWEIALKTVQEDYPSVDFPDRFPYSTEVEMLLNKKYWLSPESEKN